MTIKSGTGSYENENLQNWNKEGSITFVTPEAGPFLNLIKFMNPELNKLKAWKIIDVSLAFSINFRMAWDAMWLVFTVTSL